MVSLERSNKSWAPINAPVTAIMPNFKPTFQLICLPTKLILKKLFSRCTIPVSAMAISIGKNKISTGVKIVPNPKPEKNVSNDASAATTDIINMAISLNKTN